VCVVAEYLTLPLICSYTTLRFRILLHITAFSVGDIPGTFNSAGHGGVFSDDLNAKLLRVFDDLLQWLQSCKTVCFTRSLLVHTDLVHTDLAKPNSPTFPVKHTTNYSLTNAASHFITESTRWFATQTQHISACGFQIFHKLFCTGIFNFPHTGPHTTRVLFQTRLVAKSQRHLSYDIMALYKPVYYWKCLFHQNEYIR